MKKIKLLLMLGVLVLVSSCALQEKNGNTSVDSFKIVCKCNYVVKKEGSWSNPDKTIESSSMVEAEKKCSQMGTEPNQSLISDCRKVPL